MRILIIEDEYKTAKTTYNAARDKAVESFQTLKEKLVKIKKPWFTSKTPFKTHLPKVAIAIGILCLALVGIGIAFFVTDFIPLVLVVAVLSLVVLIAIAIEALLVFVADPKITLDVTNYEAEELRSCNAYVNDNIKTVEEDLSNKETKLRDLGKDQAILELQSQKATIGEMEAKLRFFQDQDSVSISRNIRDNQALTP